MSAVAGMLATGVLAAACSPSTPAAAPGVVRLVAGEDPWGDIASQIGGAHVQVRSLIDDPNADPHLYQSDLSDALAVAEASVVIENGAGYDSFLAKMVAATSHRGRVVVDVARVLGAGASEVNPHLWYAVDLVPVVAGAIEAALAGADPAQAAYFSTRLATFDSSLSPLQSAISSIRDRYPAAPVAYTERVPGYLIAEAGLRDVTPLGFATAVEDGNEPSPADTAAMTRLIDSRAVRLLMFNVQTVSEVTDRIRALAQRRGIPVVGVSETIAAGYTSYQDWQLAQLQSISAALADSPTSQGAAR